MNRDTTSYHFRRRAGGFTLVEMMITLAIFVLLSAAIFGIITGVLQSASSLGDNQNRMDETTAFESFLGKDLSELPGPSVLLSYRRGDGGGLDQNGIIYGTLNDLTAIDAKLQPNGLYTIRMATFSTAGQDPTAAAIFEQIITSNDGSLAWTNLIRDVRHVDWKFQDIDSLEWQTLWNDSSKKPNLVELSLQIAGDLQPTPMDFWIPPIVIPPGQALPATPIPVNAS